MRELQVEEIVIENAGDQARLQFDAGEHRIDRGKGDPYEESIRVPLIVRGPGVAPGRLEPALALNIDLAPTFLELLGVVDEPLATLPESRTRPPKEALDLVMEELR